MAIRHIDILTSDGQTIFTEDGEQLVSTTTEEYNPEQEKQWRIYRFDFKPRDEEKA